MSKLLSRHAEAIFWMARYVERAENLARVLDVNETFGRDSRGGQNWRSVLQPYTDEDAFFANHDAATAEAENHFYLIDQDNPGSIISAELADGSVDRIFARGLHEFLDWTQRELIAITEALDRELFGAVPEHSAKSLGAQTQA